MSSAPGATAVGQAPFVGRGTHLRALVSAVQAAELGERTIALVAGEPGIGKTRLVTEVAASVGCSVLWSTCWEGEGAPAFWPWRQLLRAVLTGEDADGLQASAGPLRDQLNPVLGEPPPSDMTEGAPTSVGSVICRRTSTTPERPTTRGGPSGPRRSSTCWCSSSRRPRPVRAVAGDGSAAERARSAVGWRIRAAVRHAAEVHPELGRHLQNAIRTGIWCSYRPEVPTVWEIDVGRTTGQGRSA